MKTYLPAILSLIGLLSACQKEEMLEVCSDKCTTITGRLITGSNRTPIAGADITVNWNYQAGIGYKSTVKTRSKTDSNGKYTVSFFIKNNELAEGYFDVTYSVNENQYYTIGENTVAFYRNDIKRDTLIEVADYLIPRKAYIKFAITNQSQLITEKGQFFSDFNNCYGFNTRFNQQILGGGPVIFWNSLPSQNPLPIAGDQSILIKNHKTRNGVLTVTTDSLFIPAGTTSNFTVTY